jgi:hypothetical protein
MGIVQQGSMFAGIEDAEIFTRGKYMVSGFVGVLDVAKVHVIDSRKSGPLFTVEFLVVETNNAKEHPAGSKCTWQQKLVDKEVALPEITKFAAACVGTDPGDKEKVKAEVQPGLQSVMDDAVANPDGSNEKLPKNVLIGCRITVESQDRVTANKKNIVVPIFGVWSE